MTTHNRLFPIFLKLSGRAVLIVGAGPIAGSKLSALIDTGAQIHVVAPSIHPEIERAGVQLSRREFRPSDLDRIWLVVAAATPAVNQQVAEAAEQRHVFVNAVDDPSHASAYLGGVTHRAGVTFAISTEGRAPALAGLLREGLDAVLPEADLETWMADAAEMRKKWQKDGIPMADRRPQLLRALMKRYDRSSCGRIGCPRPL
jgi:uroporphyrin-III C-methyltransferase/precorrin-2 dehydrogenase/sirohydrochlorin ferrochelatase